MTFRVPVYVICGAEEAMQNAFVSQYGGESRPLTLRLAGAERGDEPEARPEPSPLVWDTHASPETAAQKLLACLSQAAFDAVWVIWHDDCPIDWLLETMAQPSIAKRCRLAKIVRIGDAEAEGERLAAPSSALQGQLAQCDLYVLGNATKAQAKASRRAVAAYQPDVELIRAESAREVAAGLASRNLLQPLRFGLILAVCGLLIALLPRFSWQAPQAVSIFLGTFLQALPFLMLGILLSSAIQVFVPAGFLQRVFPKNLLGGMAFGVLGGFLMPVCDCASVPVFRSLLRKGVPLPAAIAFMLSAPIINPVVMLSTYYAFGGNVRIMLARMGFGVVCSLLIGLLFAGRKGSVLLEHGTAVACACGHSHEYERDQAHDHSQTHVATDEHTDAQTCADGHGYNHVHTATDDHAEAHPCACGHDHGHAATEEHTDSQPCACGHDHGHAYTQPHAYNEKKPRRIANALLALLQHFVAEFFEVAKFLLIGIGVSTLMQLALGNQWKGLNVTNLAEGMLLMMAMAFLLSLCSSSDAVVGKNMGATMPLGAVMGFLVFGPMMDIKNLILLASGFTRRFIAELLAATAAVSFAAVYLAFSLGLGGLLG